MTEKNAPGGGIPAWRLVNTEIERLMPLHRNDEGVMDDAAIKEDLTGFIRSNLERLVDPESYAKEQFARFQEFRSPYKRVKIVGLQMVLPNLDGILQMGDDTSILLREARRSHLTRREDLLKNQLHTQTFAINREIHFIHVSLGRMTAPEDTVGDVMSKDYGDAGEQPVTIRYRLDTSGPLHKIVKVVDATPPVLEPPAPAVTLEDAAAGVHRFAAGIRADTRRRRGWGFGQAPKTPDPKRDLPGADLLRARKAAGLSQRQLAAERGLSRGLVADIERGHRSCPLELADWARRVNAEQGDA